jgi:hypothetical protein
MKITNILVLAVQPLLLQAFVPSQSTKLSTWTSSSCRMSMLVDNKDTSVGTQRISGGTSVSATTDRRTWLQQSIVTGVSTVLSFNTMMVISGNQPALAATRPPLGDLLYTILRVREATEQESRLIKSGKFKDVQRANIKLAVKFMVENYRLQDAFVSAAAYLDGNERRIAAGDVGQAAVQNLGMFCFVLILFFYKQFQYFHRMLCSWQFLSFFFSCPSYHFGVL